METRGVRVQGLARFGFVALLVGGLAAAQVPGGKPADAGAVSLRTFRFEEVSAFRGIGVFHPQPGMGWGAAAADYDGDGDVDVFVPQGKGVPDSMYRNLGTGHFEDVGEELGLASAHGNRLALWIDHDGDGDLDLLVGNDSAVAVTSYRLHEQVDADTFADVTVAAGLYVSALEAPDTHRAGFCAGDLDGDGFLEVFSAAWSGLQRLFHNDGEGAFSDVSASSGVGVFEDGWQPIMVDVNEDGWLDIYHAVDFTENRMWVNGGGTMVFTDLAPAAGCAILMNDMGAAAFDYDDDGDLDLYTTNIFDPHGLSEYNVLLRKQVTVGGIPDYDDASLAVRVGDGAWGWGVTAFDADRDGVLEIAATNGWFKRADKSRLWRREAEDVQFEEIAREVGFDDKFWGSALLSFDADRDGDVDVLQVTRNGGVRLLDNVQLREGNENHWLLVKPRMAGPNSHAIGAEVVVEVGGRSMRRLISAGTSFLGQEPAEAFFGLGTATSADVVTVLYPDGTSTTLNDVAADAAVVVQAP